MNALSTFAQANTALVIFVGTIVLLSLVIYFNRHHLKYVWMEIDYKLPLVGRAARLMRRNNNRPDGSGWFPAETKVCSDYFRFFQQHTANRAHFENCRIYLEKAGELNRRPLPGYLAIMIAVLVVAEAYGFSYVLTLWGFVQAAANDVPFLAASIAVLLAVVAVFITHAAGHEQYLNSMAKRVRRDFTHDPRNGGVPLQRSPHTVRLDTDQRADNGELPAIQALNRLERRPSEINHIWTIAATVFVIFIAVASTVIRLEAFKVSQIDEQQRTEEQFRADSGSVKVGQIPQHLAQQSQAAASKTISDRAGADETGAWTTFMTMAAIFVAIQGVAVMLGFKYGFAGSESEKAWRATHAFDNPEDYEAYHNNKRAEIVNQAQARLSDIQGRILKAVEKDPTGGPQIQAAAHAGQRTFAVYATHIAPVVLSAPAAQYQPQPAPQYQPQHYQPQPAPQPHYAAHPQQPAAPHPGYQQQPVPGGAQPQQPYYQQPQPQPVYHQPVAPHPHPQPNYYPQQPQPQGYAPAPQQGYAPHPAQGYAQPYAGQQQPMPPQPQPVYKPEGQG